MVNECEVYQHGLPFVKSEDGTTVFGEKMTDDMIGSAADRTEAPDKT